MKVGKEGISGDGKIKIKFKKMKKKGSGRVSISWEPIMCVPDMEQDMLLWCCP